MAPEIFEKQKYNHKADIWSLGITALELAFGKGPYEGLRPLKIMMQITEGKEPAVDDYGKSDFHKSFKQFVGKCLLKDPQKRASAKDLSTSKFLQRAKGHEYVREKIVTRTSGKVYQAPMKEIPRSLKEIRMELAKLASTVITPVGHDKASMDGLGMGLDLKKKEGDIRHVVVSNTSMNNSNIDRRIENTKTVTKTIGKTAFIISQMDDDHETANGGSPSGSDRDGLYDDRGDSISHEDSVFRYSLNFGSEADDILDGENKKTIGRFEVEKVVDK